MHFSPGMYHARSHINDMPSFDLKLVDLLSEVMIGCASSDRLGTPTSLASTSRLAWAEVDLNS